MNLKMMNESFKRKYSNTLTEQMDSNRDSELKKALEESIQHIDKTDLRLVEGAFQATLEKLNPDKSWWEVTDCMINESLFNEGVEATLNRLVEEDNQKTNNNIIYSKNGVEVEHKAGNYFTVTKNGVAQKGFYVDDNGKDEEQIKQRARDKASMGDFKDDPGTNDDMNESKSIEEEWVKNPDAVIDVNTPFHNAAIAKELGIPAENILWEIEPNGFSVDPDFKDYIVRDVDGNSYNVRVMGPRPAGKNRPSKSYSKSINEESTKDNSYYFWYVGTNDAGHHYEDEQTALRVYNKLVKDYTGDEELIVLKCIQTPDDVEVVKVLKGNLLDESKSIDESFNNWIISKLKEHLCRLNEAEMSDEDKHDSDLIRSMNTKLQKRSNARFTPEEQAILNKYGLTRNNYEKTLYAGNRPLVTRNRFQSTYGYNDEGKRIEYNNGTESKYNYAAAARKRPGRDENQVGGIWNPNSDINRHRDKSYSWGDHRTLQSVERIIQDEKDREPVVNMQHAIRDKDYYDQLAGSALSDFDKKIAAIDAEAEKQRASARSMRDWSLKRGRDGAQNAEARKDQIRNNVRNMYKK